MWEYSASSLNGSYLVTHQGLCDFLKLTSLFSSRAGTRAQIVSSSYALAPNTGIGKIQCIVCVFLPSLPSSQSHPCGGCPAFPEHLRGQPGKKPECPPCQSGLSLEETPVGFISDAGSQLFKSHLSLVEEALCACMVPFSLGLLCTQIFLISRKRSSPETQPLLILGLFAELSRNCPVLFPTVP